MKIAFFSECYSPIVNGVVVAVSTLRAELLRLGHEVALFAPRYPGHIDTDAGVFRLPSISFPTNPRYPVGIPRFSRKMLNGLKDFSPEIIHTHSLFGMGRAAKKAARIFGTPLIFTYHTLIEDYSHYIPLPQGYVRGMARKISRSFAQSADCVIAPGPAAKDRLLEYGVTSPIEVIPTGADLSLAETAPAAFDLSRWAIPPGAPVVCFAGRIAKEKNLELLVLAFARLRQELPAAQLLLIGGGPWEEPIRRLAHSLNQGANVHITGFISRPELFGALSHASLFAFPSQTDTQGIAVLEAMAAGLPVVAVRSGAVAEILRDNVEGLTAAPDPEAFARSLLSLLQDPALREKMRMNARARAQEFSAANCATRVLALYEQVLSRCAENGCRPPPSD